MIVELFAGPGGWSEGLRAAGRHDGVGLEKDQDACVTAVAAGHKRVRADVATYPTGPFRDVEGIIASPPCTAFSLTGKGAGREAVPALLDAIRGAQWTALRDMDPTVWLPLEVGRWLEDTNARWIACEQVPPALPLWDAYAVILRSAGWYVWHGVLNAADYGVPQARKRAFLLASQDVVANPPDPTHTKMRNMVTLFGELEPWVPAAYALGWDDRQDLPDWVFERPATTVISTGRIAEPGHRCMTDDCCGNGPRHHFDGESVPITVDEAAVLQSFHRGYPWAGSKTSQYQQIGNAVPPLLAKQILEVLV